MNLQLKKKWKNSGLIDSTLTIDDTTKDQLNWYMWIR